MVTLDQSFVFPPDRFPSFAVPTENPAEEYGPPLKCNTSDSSYPWLGNRFSNIPSDEEIQAGRMELSYSCAENKYFRPVIRASSPGTDADSVLPMGWNDWKDCVWRYTNIARKDERDWNMTYLARYENITPETGAAIEWRFDLKSRGMKVKELKVRVPYKLYRDGTVRVSVCSRDDYTILQDPQRLRSVVRATGWEDFIIRAELTGLITDGGVHYQNAQLFRQPIRQKSASMIPSDWTRAFKVVVEMEPC